MRTLLAGAVLVSLLISAGVARGDGGGVELGLLGGGHVFSTKTELGVADDPGRVPSPDPMALGGLRIGVALSSAVALEAEAVAVPTRDSYDDRDVLVVGWRAHLRVALGRFSRVTPFVVAGAGALSAMSDETAQDAIREDTDFAPHWGLGLAYQMSDMVVLRLDGRHLLVPSTGDGELTSDLEAHLGLTVRLGAAERPAPPPPPPPPPPEDSDGDGLTDDVDSCIAEPEDKDGFDDEDGCPEPDNDGDGLLDEEDRCPNEAETVNGIDDLDGCPETDPDGDGLVGSADRCPDLPEDKDGFQDEDGCPDPDNDGDGVPDADDQCPAAAETRNGFEDDDGCPDEIPKKVSRFTGVIRGITFKKNSADIRGSSFRVLNQAVRVLEDYPDLRIEISGHTSSEGDRDHNLRLSEERAESVKAYLVAQGIDESRITTVGHGPDQPIASNRSRRGRNKNRRIEFRLIVDPGQAPPPVETAPPEEPE